MSDSTSNDTNTNIFKLICNSVHHSPRSFLAVPKGNKKKIKRFFYCKATSALPY